LCLEKAVRYVENNTSPTADVKLETVINNSGKQGYYPYIRLEINDK